jgi:hypothetical protein
MTAMKSNAGVEVSTKKVCGYEFQVMKMPSGWVSFRAPMGTNSKDKKMFDELVYYHQMTYHGQSILEVEKKVRDFIKSYKGQEEVRFIDAMKAKTDNRSQLSRKIFKIYSYNSGRYRSITIRKAIEEYTEWQQTLGAENISFEKWLLTEL